MSFSTGLIPQDWKKSVIFPIKKKARSLKIEDFRPINIISCICRVFERIIRNAIFHYLINDRINKSQHGFLSGRSTTTALLSYSNDVSNSLDNGLCVDTAYFDFSKAFDSVRHDYLIQKLSYKGLSGSLLTWIINYLKNHTQVFNIHVFFSTERQVSKVVLPGIMNYVVLS